MLLGEGIQEGGPAQKQHENDKKDCSKRVEPSNQESANNAPHQGAFRFASEPVSPTAVLMTGAALDALRCPAVPGCIPVDEPDLGHRVAMRRQRPARGVSCAMRSGL